MPPKTNQSQSGPEEFVKYYKCLTLSFNKIQTKDQKVSLTNAAKRPKIVEHFRDHDDVLTSYLNYLQVFINVYPDQFEDVCKSVLLPLLKLDVPRDERQILVYKTFHKALAEIVGENHDLAEELISFLTRNFPFHENTTDNSYLNFVYNYLQVCVYIPKSLTKSALVALIDKLMWLDLISDDDNKQPENTEDPLSRLSFETIELVYEFLDEVKQDLDVKIEEFFLSFVIAFQKVLLSTTKIKKIHQLVFYLCSIKTCYSEELLNSLWEAVIERNRGFEEKKAAIAYISSLLSRASYIDVDIVIKYLSKALSWCNSFIDPQKNANLGNVRRRMSSGNQGMAVFYLVCQSIFYITTQRHRDLYDEDVAKEFRNLPLNRILNKKWKSLQLCDPQTCRRFEGVAHMYKLAQLPDKQSSVGFDEEAEMRANLAWHLPFNENLDNLPARLVPLHRTYFDHSNFTVHREE